LRRPLWLDPDIVVLRRHEHPIGVLEAAGLDSIDEDDESTAEGRPRLRRGADEIGDRGAAALHHAIAQPAHAPRLLDAVLHGKPKLAVDVRAHLVVVEDDCVEHRREHPAHRRLAGTGQTHDENLAVQDRRCWWVGGRQVVLG